MQITNWLLLMGGLAMFLYGMGVMGDGLELAAGPRLRTLMEKLTKNKVRGVLVGAGTTSIIQSSSATTVMVVGFVNAGIITLTQAVGVIMGANIGTTVTGIMISIQVDLIAPVILFVGVVLFMIKSLGKIRYFAQIMIGFGLLFMGLTLMKDAMIPLATDPTFTSLVARFTNPFLAVLAGAGVTAVIQSSSASVGILQALASQGGLPLSSTAFILFGQNIGTCVTALLASIGTSKTAKRAAVVHLLFNVFGTVLFVGILLIPRLLGLPTLVELIEHFLPSGTWNAAHTVFTPGMEMAQIAAIHVIFNVVNTAILLPFSNLLVRAATFLVPGKDKLELAPLHLEFLDKRILSTPSIAVLQVIKETERMALTARTNIELAISTLFTPSDKRNNDTIRQVYENEKLIDYLNDQVTEYLISVNALELGDGDSQKTGALFHVVNDLERIGDHCENLVELSQQLSAQNLKFSDDAVLELRKVIDKVMGMVDGAIKVFDDEKFTPELLGHLDLWEEEVDRMTTEFKQNHIERLNKHICSPKVGIVFIEALTNLERIADHATNIAFSDKNSAYK